MAVSRWSTSLPGKPECSDCLQVHPVRAELSSKRVQAPSSLPRAYESNKCCSVRSHIAIDGVGCNYWDGVANTNVAQLCTKSRAQLHETVQSRVADQVAAASRKTNLLEFLNSAELQCTDCCSQVAQESTRQVSQCCVPAPCVAGTVHRMCTFVPS